MAPPAHRPHPGTTVLVKVPIGLQPTTLVPSNWGQTGAYPPIPNGTMWTQAALGPPGLTLMLRH